MAKVQSVQDVIDAYQTVLAGAVRDAELCEATYNTKYAALDGYRTEMAAVLQALRDKHEFAKKDAALTKASDAVLTAQRRVVEMRLRLICKLLSMLFLSDPAEAEHIRSGFVAQELGIKVQNEDYMLRPSLSEQFEAFVLNMDAAGLGRANMDDDLGDYVLTEHSTDVTEEWSMTVVIPHVRLQEFESTIKLLSDGIAVVRADFEARTQAHEAREREKRYETYLKLKAEFEPEKKKQ